MTAHHWKTVPHFLISQLASGLPNVLVISNKTVMHLVLLVFFHFFIFKSILLPGIVLSQTKQALAVCKLLHMLERTITVRSDGEEGGRVALHTERH